MLMRYDKHDFKIFFNAYLEALMFISENESRKESITADAMEILKVHALSFFMRSFHLVYREDPAKDYTDLGHDFAMTHTGTGAGFWDGDWPKFGETLTKLSECYPEEIDYEALFVL